MDPTTPQEEAKKALLAKLDTYVDEKILFAGSMVVANAASKIEDGDIVLTYAHSSVILRILQAAREVGHLQRDPNSRLFAESREPPLQHVDRGTVSSDKAAAAPQQTISHRRSITK